MMVDAQVAVRSFFIISGFYMALILNEKYIGKNGTYKLFITNRFMRIFPIYWVILIFYFIYYFLNFDKSPQLFQIYFHNIFSFHTLVIILKNIFLFNFIIVPRDISIFNVIHIPIVLNFLLDVPAWSVGVELMFYLIAPFITRLKLKRTLLLVVIYLIMHIVLQPSFLNHFINALELYFFPFEFLYFLIGIVSYWIFTKVRNLKIKKEIITFISLALIMLTIIYNFIPLFTTNATNWGRIIYYSLIAAGIPFLFMGTSKNKISNFLGELSYPIYISQYLVLDVFKNYLNFGFLNQNVITFLEILAVVIFSYILYAFIMKPIDSYRARRLKRKSVRPSIITKKVPAYAVATD